MRNNLLVTAGLAACLTFTSCAAGPQQLQRSVDDWDHKMYVKNPLLDGVLWVVPVFPLLNFGAAIGDFFIGNAYFFWFHDVWDQGHRLRARQGRGDRRHRLLAAERGLGLAQGQEVT